ncbi:MAG: hypothetical protein COW65_11765 [Cytophagales bacterium CG18_big_fil_WC_8_21_14_2_50_42_9]|nr:MAG: hypothetical protein COW65_11765 [Cytophagales bacterium CG18_big_fil_WC_8_21_14_2_50_42_9]
MSELINKVAQSALVTLNLEELIHPGERVVYDIKENLFMSLILKEKDFRAFVKENDWSVYAGKNVAIINSADAIVPTWAYMLLATKLQPYANRYVFGDLEALEQALFQEAISKINPEEYQEAKVVVKGCGQIPVPTYAYVEIMNLLLPVVSSIMYGEPCSTVPLYKKSKV